MFVDESQLVIQHRNRTIILSDREHTAEHAYIHVKMYRSSCTFALTRLDATRLRHTPIHIYNIFAIQLFSLFIYVMYFVVVFFTDYGLCCQHRAITTTILMRCCLHSTGFTWAFNAHFCKRFN